MNQEQSESQNRSRKIELSREIIKLESDQDPELYVPSPDGGLLKVPTKGAEFAGELRKRFWNMLASTITEEMYTPPQDRQTVILDLGCGKCDEGLVLSAYFGGGKYGYHNDNVYLVGIDTNEKDILKARQNYSHRNITDSSKPEHSPLPNYMFIHGDATKPDTYAEVPPKADVVVIRHQQISQSKETWTKIFSQGLDRLSPKGIMILTSYGDTEHEMATEVLNSMDCEILVDQENQNSKPLEKGDVSVDKRIAILKKKSD